MLLTAVPFFVGATWRLPDTYHSAGFRRGTATLKFYEDRDILARAGSFGFPACPQGRHQGLVSKPWHFLSWATLWGRAKQDDPPGKPAWQRAAATHRLRTRAAVM